MKLQKFTALLLAVLLAVSDTHLTLPTTSFV